jgi:hypothetical protein
LVLTMLGQCFWAISQPNGYVGDRVKKTSIAENQIE